MYMGGNIFEGTSHGLHAVAVRKEESYKISIG